MSDASSVRYAKSLPAASGRNQGSIRYSGNEFWGSTGTQYAPQGRAVVQAQIPIAADDVSQNIFIADRPYVVVGLQEVHATAGGSGAAITVTKCTGTQAPSAGSTLIAALASAPSTPTTAFDATATANTVQTAVLNSTSTILSAVITNGGSGYASTPVVTISDAYADVPGRTGGSGATATASLTNGVVTAITITAAGSGYVLPKIEISGGTPGAGATATAVTNNLVLNTGDRLALVAAGTATPLAGAVVTAVLRPL